MTIFNTEKISALDTHCHSKFSGEASEWFLRKMGCPESFTEPVELYNRAKKRGMQFVTITDHNVIDGCLEIAHLDDVVISCEVATYFPDNGCKIDILVIDISESQYEECMKLRPNVFDLVAYLNKENIFHSLAHPLYNMNGKLDLEHFEQLLLMFKNMEILNGARTKAQNLTIERVISRLDQKIIDTLANKYDMEPVGVEPWIKVATSGSDDHGGLLIGSNGTGVPKVSTFEEWKAQARAGNTEIIGTIGTAHTLAHNIYRAAYLYIVNILGAYSPQKGDPLNFMVMKLFFDDDSHKPSAGEYLRFKMKNKLLGRDKDNSPGQIMTVIKEEAKALVKRKPEHKELLHKQLPHDKDELNQVIFSFMSDLANMVLARLGREFITAVRDVHVNKVIDLIPALGTMHFFLLPYYVSYGATNRSNSLIRHVGEKYLPEAERVRNTRKVAMFTDTFDEVNGVSVIVKQMAQEALNSGSEMLIVKSGKQPDYQDENIVHFNSVADVEIPEYPDLELHFPSLLDILDWCEQQEFTCIHAATPGTMGLIALLVAKVLHLPFVGTYHTELSDYVRYLTGSDSVAKFSSRLANWFYGQMDVIFAPSNASKMNLIDHGLDPDLIKFIPWGVDMERFNTIHRDESIWDRHGIRDKIKLLYAGRVSKEKNLDELAECFRIIAGERDNVHLVIAGDGPYRKELEKKMSDLPTTFLGYLSHQELATYYASADMFIFPSTTDTFGNVIIEALASGLPVVVSDKGGPKENVIHGETGFITRALDVEDLTNAVRRLVDDTGLRRRMSAAARPSVEDKSRQESFRSYWGYHK